MYERASRLSGRKRGELLKLFVAGVTARAASQLTGVHRNTAASYFMRLRRLIASQLPSYGLSDEVEADESYFGGARKGRRGRGAAGKVAVFGLLKRKGKVFTAIVPNVKAVTLLPIIKEQVRPDSIVYTDTFKAYNALDVASFHHVRINHAEHFAEERNHINGIENFWNHAICGVLTALKRNIFTGF
jgi:transposase